MLKKEEHSNLFRRVFFFNTKRHWFLFKLKYPKILLLVICMFLAYWAFSNPMVQNYFSTFSDFSYEWIFIAGLLYSFGFTAPFALGYFLIIEPPNIFLASLIGGVGSALSDLLIFSFVRLSFKNEFKKLTHEHIVQSTKKYLHELIDGSKFLIKASRILFYVLALFIISSPLPDEIGVSMLAGLSKIKAHALGMISLVMSTIGIYVILAIS